MIAWQCMPQACGSRRLIVTVRLYNPTIILLCMVFGVLCRVPGAACGPGDTSSSASASGAEHGSHPSAVVSDSGTDHHRRDLRSSGGSSGSGGSRVSIDTAAEAAAVLPKSPTDLNSSSRTIHRVCVGLLHVQSATASWCCSAGGCPALPAHPQPALHCCSRLLRTPAVCSGLLVCVCASVLHSSTAVSIALLVWQLCPVLRSRRCSASIARCWRVANWLRACSSPTVVPYCVAAGMLAWLAALTVKAAP